MLVALMLAVAVAAALKGLVLIAFLNNTQKISIMKIQGPSCRMRGD